MMLTTPVKVEELLRDPAEVIRRPVEVFRTPKRHEGGIAAGPPDYSYRAFELLYLAFIATPAIAGTGMLFSLLASWDRFLAPALANALGAFAARFIQGAGAVEIALALWVAVYPRWGGWTAAAWLWIGILNLLLIPGHYGLALCMAALSAGACALSLLAKDYERRP